MPDRRHALAVLASGLAAASVRLRAQTPAPPLRTLRVITFDGGWNLPLWAAQRQGFFEANGVQVQTTYTPSSAFLVAGLLEGRFDIGLALVDNLVAYQEGQGEARIPDDPDLFAFMGGDGGFLSVLAAPSIRSFADLKGKTLSVDAMSTGAAFVLRELVARNGLAEGDVNFVRAGGTANRYRELLAGRHDATLLRTPFDLLALSRGFRQLATAEALGAYQGTTGLARRSWAQANEAALVGFILAMRAAAAWLHEPAQREIVEALLVANSRDLTPALARQAAPLLLADKGGIARDLALDATGFATVLALRAKYGTPSKPLGDMARYVDLRYYDRAAVAAR